MRIINFTSSELKRVVLEQFISRYSKDFSPPFTSRVKSVSIYVEKLCQFGTFHIGLAEGGIAGMIGFYANDTVNKVTYISYLCVSNKYRNTKLAEWLITACVDHSINKCMMKIRVNTELINTRAIRFYIKNEFIITNKWIKNGIEKIELERNL